MNLRNDIIKRIRAGNYIFARMQIGRYLHTLQDFYSHSNWIEMGNTVPNPNLGLNEDIGQVLGPNEQACHARGCRQIIVEADALQALVLKRRYLIYYDCYDNILRRRGIVIKGRRKLKKSFNFVKKPAGVSKCSHGGILDRSATEDAVGGINKDSIDVLYSPHHHLHLEAARVSVMATEQFFNKLREEIGNRRFSQLLFIDPSDDDDQRVYRCDQCNMEVKVNGECALEDETIGRVNSNLDDLVTVIDRISERDKQKEAEKYVMEARNKVGLHNGQIVGFKRTCTSARCFKHQDL
ncbi:hypothetical protein ACOME3_007378 [Neoechinorhynchus agilis]